MIGYSTLTEVVPPRLRGRWIGYLAVITNVAVAASALAGYFLIPTLGWRVLFGLAGMAALIVWHARKNMPESPRWLESVGRYDEADRVMASFADVLGGAYALVSTIEAATAIGFFWFLAMYLLAALGLAVAPYFTAWAYPRGAVALILEAFCGVLLFQALVILLSGIRTENRSLEDLVPDVGRRDIIESKVVEA